MALLAALFAAVGYGTANFMGGMASRRQHAAMTLLISQTAALILILVLALLAGGVIGSVRLGALAGIIAFCGAALAYVCFSLGRPIGVAAALLGMNAVAVPVIAGVIGGQYPGTLGWIGLSVALVAIIIFAWPQQGTTDATAAMLATAAGCSFGAYHTVMSHSNPDSGMWPVVASQWVIVLLSIVFVLLVRAQTGLHSVMAMSAGDGIASVVATIAALVAVRGAALPIAGTLIALSPAITLLLARMLLTERFNLRKGLGLTLAGAAVVLLTFPS
ncbi:MAG: EamA family transporter [Patescibacteria group bacterium]